MPLPALLQPADNPAIRAAIRADLGVSDLADVVVAAAYGPSAAQVVAVDPNVPLYPPTPTVSPAVVVAGTGGSVPAGTYQVAFSWAYNTPLGFSPPAALESGASLTSTVLASGATSTLAVSPPALPPGATGFNVYLSQPGGAVLTRQNASPVATPSYVQSVAPTSTGQSAPAANSDFWQRAHDAAVLLAAAYLLLSVPLIVRESFQGYSYSIDKPMDPGDRADMLRALAYELLVLNLGESAMQLLKPKAFVAAIGGRGDVSDAHYPLDWRVY